MFHWPKIGRKPQPGPSGGDLEQLAADLPRIIEPNLVPRSDGASILPGDGPHVRVMTLAEASREEEHRHHRSSFDFVDAILIFLLIGTATIASLAWNRRGAIGRSSFPAVVSPVRTIPPSASRSFGAPSTTAKPHVFPNRGERRQEDSARAGDAVPDSAPRPVLTVAASYTDQARYANYRTKVYVAVTVSKQGLPAHIEMTAPLPFDLEPAVRQAVAQWRFTPAMRGGETTEAKGVYEVPFR